MTPKQKTSTPKLHLDGQTLVLKGVWAGLTLGHAETLLVEVLPQLPKTSLTVEIQADRMDSNGVLLINHFLKSYSPKFNAPKRILDLFNTTKAISPEEPKASEEDSWPHAALTNVGQTAVYVYNTGESLLNFFGEILVTFVNFIKAFRLKGMITHVEDFGVNALPIVGLISFLIGMVLAYQGINQLSRFGAEIFSVDFLGIGVLREIGVLITSIVVAGRSGSSITAQIGIMKMNQEIDAIRMMGLNPIHVLVIPRLSAMLVALPCLVFFSNILALLGGMLMTTLVIELSTREYWNLMQKAVSTTHFWVGMSKTPLFAIIISIVACFRGFQVKGSAESVGEMTTRSVVEAIFLVIVCDALVSIMYSYLKV